MDTGGQDARAPILMKQISLLISRYLVSTIFPYFVFAWLLLSVILFVQQASHYSDIFFSVNIPANLIWQLTIALIPSVIAFTCPMAMMVGTIVGLTKMQGDSELVAIRASGVGNFQIALPIMLLGLLLSAFAFFINLEGVPLAASLVRNVALQTAIKKLESPIEPGVFNTEVAGYTIYVKGGDFETGQWKNIFIYREDVANGNQRLITSQNGRIDTTDQLSELVLENAVVTTIPIDPGNGKYVSENLGEVRLAIQTKRSDLISRMTSSQLSPEELGLQQLSEYASSADGKERIEAQILWQRRITLSITPLIFCLLGTVIVLRFNRGGRGFGSILAIGVLVGFYLLSFLGEQLARTGKISVSQGSLIPLLGSLAVILWFNYSRKIDFWSGWGTRVGSIVKSVWASQNKLEVRNFFVDLTTGLRDFDIVRNLLKNFILTLVFLSAIFVIFTAFELWKFAGTFDGGVLLLAKYLFYLLPFIYLQIAPSAAMIGTLVTYVVKSRQNEIVTWTSAGQSVYRLLVPCFLLMLLIGGLNFVLQERILPNANRQQDDMRNLLRNRGVPEGKAGKYWVANGKRIYSFEFEIPNSPTIRAGNSRFLDLSQIPIISASDNEKRDVSLTVGTQNRSASDNVKHEEGFLNGQSNFFPADNERELPNPGLRRAVNLETANGWWLYGVPSYLGRQGADFESHIENRDQYVVTRFDPSGTADNETRTTFGRIWGGGRSASDNEMVDGLFSLELLLPMSVKSEDVYTYCISQRPHSNLVFKDRLGSGDRLKFGEYIGAPDNEKRSRALPLGFFNPYLNLVSLGKPTLASDNEKRDVICFANCVKNLTVYQFADNGENLQFVYRSKLATWDGGKIRFLGDAEKDDLAAGKIVTTMQAGGEIDEKSNPFLNLRAKPNHLTSAELKVQLAAADSELESRNLTVALNKKYTSLFLPFVMALFTAPFSLRLGRKGNVATVGYAIGLWLLFTGTSTVFEQLGLNGLLSPSLAVWSPLTIFGLLGVYLLSKVRT